MAERLRFRPVSPSLFFHAVMLKRHERQRGSTLAAQFDLASSEIKDCACKEGSEELFGERPNFSHYLTKEYNSAGATLAKPKGKGTDCSSYTKLIKEPQNPLGSHNLSLCWKKMQTISGLHHKCLTCECF